MVSTFHSDSQNSFQNMLRTFLSASKNLFKTPRYKIPQQQILKMATDPKKPKLIEASNLVWIDCEMTGLDERTDHLIEIAVIVTDKDLNVLGEGPNLVIHQPDEVTNPLNFYQYYNQISISDLEFDE